jgi:hypothetical protein
VIRELKRYFFSCPAIKINKHGTGVGPGGDSQYQPSWKTYDSGIQERRYYISSWLFLVSSIFPSLMINSTGRKES